MPAQLANESFGAGHVRFRRNAMGAVVHVPMRSDFSAAEAFLGDHLRVPLPDRNFGGHAWSVESSISIALRYIASWLQDRGLKNRGAEMRPSISNAAEAATKGYQSRPILPA
jgi:hypothetical protein